MLFEIRVIDGQWCLDAFNKSVNVVNKEHDRLSGRKPIEFIQAANPIVVIDEPQNMESAQSRAAIVSLTLPPPGALGCRPFCREARSAGAAAPEHSTLRRAAGKGPVFSNRPRLGGSPGGSREMGR